MMKIRVAVIGSGAAGLCALRHLTNQPELFEATGFEQLSGVGGTWRYTDCVGTYKNGKPVQSSMYKNLKTNLPKEVMAFPGFPFPSNLPSFIRHEDVLQYLKDYCYNYNLEKFIKFDTKVDHIVPVSNGSTTEWQVTYSSSADEVHSQVFDAVFVCNGHYSVPLVPNLEGSDVFAGTIIHSHDYRVPEMFKDKTVVCLGAASSGQDISLDVAKTAKKVILSHNKPRLQTPLLDNMCQQPGIQTLTSESVIFKNGIEEKVDAILLCTGYKYYFPFLDKTCEVTINDERVTPLYKHLIHAKFPTLAFIGVCKVVCPFPLFENQVRYVLSFLDGSQKLPTEEEMLTEIEQEFNERLASGLPPRFAHTMGPKQWAYNDSLAELGKFEALPVVVQRLYDEVSRMRKENLPNYKNKQYKLVDDKEYAELQAS